MLEAAERVQNTTQLILKSSLANFLPSQYRVAAPDPRTEFLKVKTYKIFFSVMVLRLIDFSFSWCSY
jgi:hypothetical protein